MLVEGVSGEFRRGAGRGARRLGRNYSIISSQALAAWLAASGGSGGGAALAQLQRLARAAGWLDAQK